MPELQAPRGPVDIAVLGFLDARPDGSVAEVVSAAVADGAVRILDAIVVARGDDGELSVVDVDEGDEVQAILGVPIELPGLLGADDVGAVADEVPAGATAVLVVWENVWAARLADALGRVGGQVLAHERVSVEDVDAVIDAFETA